MSLEQAIHNRWAADAALIALVPASRFVTGKMLGGAALPYATLTRNATRHNTRTSSHQVDDIRVQFDVWANSLDTGKQIGDAIQTRFHATTFTDAGVTVLRMRRIDAGESQSDDGTWRLALEYEATVEM